MPAPVLNTARPLALVGPPGAGKSSVGRAVADLAGCPCIDLDLAIAQDAGSSIAHLFNTLGEQGFRAQEANTLYRCLQTQGPFVLACGGGTWMQAELRAQLDAVCHVVCLNAAPDTLLARILAEPWGAPRPLLQGADPQKALRALLRRRAKTYASCAWQVDTTSSEVPHVARRVWATWQQPGAAGGVR